MDKTVKIENAVKKIENERKKGKNIQELDIFWKRIILFSVLFVLAVPLTALIVWRFTKRTADFSGDMIIQQLEIDSEVSESFLQIDEAVQGFQEQFDETATTSTSLPLSTGTSTDITATTTDE